MLPYTRMNANLLKNMSEYVPACYRACVLTCMTPKRGATLHDQIPRLGGGHVGGLNLRGGACRRIIATGGATPRG